MTTTKISKIQREIKNALKKIEAENDVEISLTEPSVSIGISYTSNMRITSIKENNQTNKTLENLCKKVGFKQNVIGMEFISGGYKNKIVSIKTRNSKYPVIVERTIGNKVKSYKYPVISIKSELGGDKGINRRANLNKLKI